MVPSPFSSAVVSAAIWNKSMLLYFALKSLHLIHFNTLVKRFLPHKCYLVIIALCLQPCSLCIVNRLFNKRECLIGTSGTAEH